MTPYELQKAAYIESEKLDLKNIPYVLKENIEMNTGYITRGVLPKGFMTVMVVKGTEVLYSRTTTRSGIVHEVTLAMFGYVYGSIKSERLVK